MPAGTCSTVMGDVAEHGLPFFAANFTYSQLAGWKMHMKTFFTCVWIFNLE